jgi:hypothetical protein
VTLEDNADLVNGDPVVAVSNYTSWVKSVDFSFRSSFARLGIARYNIHVVIEAPAALDTAAVEGEHVFFIDSCPRRRELGEGRYQIVYEGEQDDKQGFLSWANQCVEFFKLMQFHIGLVCVDYADFRTALCYCKGKTLRFEWLPYDQYDGVPYHTHKAPGYRVLYGCLCGALDSSLQQYIELSDVLETENPDLVMTKLAMTVGQYDPPVMMLLGEADGR